MILFHNGYIVLEYDASTDILQAVCPDFRQEEMLHIYAAFAVMINILKVKRVQYLLLDTSRSVLDMNQEDYNTVMALLIGDLTATNLKKLARLIASDLVNNVTLYHLLQESAETKPLPYIIQNFTSKEAAIAWLKQA